jgi:hypothetical protein
MNRIPFSKWLLFPLIFFILSLGYIILKNDWIYLSPYLGAVLIVLAIVFVFSPQIDWWWWSIFTPKLDPRIVQLIQDKRPEYCSLDHSKKELFHKRLFLYMQGKDYTFMDIDETPEDIKAIAATYPILLTLHQRAFLMDPYDKIIFFRKRFSSPEQKTPHASEHHKEDKVLIFSMIDLAAGFADATSKLDIGLYEFIQLYWELFGFPAQLQPSLDWQRAEQSGMWTPSFIEQNYGLSNVNESALMLCNAQAFKVTFEQQFPEWDQFFKNNLPYYLISQATFS